MFKVALFTLIQVGLASRYGYPGDKFDIVGSYACKAILIKKIGLKSWDHMRENGVAHRTLPCGAKIMVCHNQRCIKAYVVDRGPYGAITKKGWKLRRKLQSGERYRGVLDLLPGPSKALNIRGLNEVKIFL